MRRKKRLCKICGCILGDYYVGGCICDCCRDDRRVEEDPDPPEAPEKVEGGGRIMIVYIYDIEVFSDDWIVVFRRPEDGANHIVIHNDNARLRDFLAQDDIVIGGFNNKHYDDYVVMVMLNGGSTVEVKRCNDFIIVEGRNPWEFPFIQFQKKPFLSFDLRDDIPDPGISLKAIEGNLKLPIVESSVPFDINRKLTPEELEEVIKYCKNDVDATVRLYQERKADYLDAKILVGQMYDVPPEEAIGYTNARLSARVLDAKYTERNDERDYTLPPNLDPERIPKIVLDFFMQIRDKSIPDAKLFGAGKGSKGMTLDLILRSSYGSCPVTYAWGGVHGAKPCVIIEETEDRVIINQDVASLYPNSMINFGYTSRSMADPEAYAKLVKRRIEYKRAGDKTRANALKLVVNTCYGAMLSTGNGLNDRLGGRSVCITNQLAMSILISDLCKGCATIDFVNINTDGIMFTIDRKEVERSEEIVKDWCTLTGFEMERDDFAKVIQKDVNNYIGIKADGHFKTKGGYVSLYEGGSFKTNSLQIIHKAIVDNLVKGVDPEETIRGCTDITQFQQIIKTGGTYEGSYHYVDGQREKIQNVNRVYAVKDPRYGSVVKGKWITEKRKKNKDTGKMESTPVNPPVWQETVISECPEHTGIDNENRLTVADLDLKYYIDMARKRIDKYINADPTVARKISKIDKEVVIMATKAESATAEKEFTNVHSKLQEARLRFQKAGVKKSGKNLYAEFKYFTLDDIIPAKSQIFSDLGLCDLVSFEADRAILKIVNVEDPEDYETFTSPLAQDESLIKNPIQKLGAVETYIRRYLYILALDIIESDGIEGTTGKPVDEDDKPVTTSKKNNRPATAAERADTKSELVNADGLAEDTQKKAISNALKKLRSFFMDKDKNVTDEALEERYSDYIQGVAKTVKAGKLTKLDADKLLIEIGEKIAEAEAA